ncbi:MULTISPECIES: stage VI sporulation protein F [Thalassobacillus]|uniref:stage VI sporulation protein F n=1 Tax=Thalassobacillus TaxID=331971 RepID=UPI000A1CA234|nr:stage VI sporulation protein F [Thalassobacillus devorans]
MLDNFEKKTGVKMDDVMRLVQSLRGADLSDERTVRQVIKKVSRLANKPVSRSTEDKIVKAILSGNVPKDMSTIEKMLNNKKR